MKKTILIAAGFIALASVANATPTTAPNSSSTAQQTVQLALSNALEITFTGNNATTGTTVSIPFTSVNDYQSGVSSTAQELKVRSNKNFDVSVKTDAAYFTVTNGSNTAVSTMPASVLGVKVSANTTGGTIAGNFASFTNLSNTAANLITGGTHGGDQKFSVTYFANPGFTYPAGTYAINVVYTATQQ